MKKQLFAKPKLKMTEMNVLLLYLLKFVYNFSNFSSHCFQISKGTVK